MNAKYSIHQAGLGQGERLFIDKMLQKGKLIIRAKDLRQELGNNIKNPNLVLSRLYKKGWVQRLKSGVYRIIPLGSDSVNPIPEDAWLIGMELFDPCYIGGWSAAEHWDLTEQIFNKTFVFTSKKQRNSNQKVAGLLFRTKFISKSKIFGTAKIWSSNHPIFISDIHRTLIDILDDPSVGGGGRALIDIANSYKQKNIGDFETLWQYAQKLDSGAAYRRLGFIAQRILKIPDTNLEQIQNKIATGIILLDPKGPKKGPIQHQWRLRINIPLQDIV